MFFFHDKFNLSQIIFVITMRLYYRKCRQFKNTLIQVHRSFCDVTLSRPLSASALVIEPLFVKFLFKHTFILTFDYIIGICKSLNTCVSVSATTILVQYLTMLDYVQRPLPHCLTSRFWTNQLQVILVWYHLSKNQVSTWYYNVVCNWNVTKWSVNS